MLSSQTVKPLQPRNSFKYFCDCNIYVTLKFELNVFYWFRFSFIEFCVSISAGLSIHTFHGNFFVRSTDLLSLPNVNPDAGFAVQMSIEDNLDDMQVVSFQAALLYTSSKGTNTESQLFFLFFSFQ